MPAKKKPTPGLSRLVRTPEATEHSHLSRRTLYRLAEEGQITRYKIRSATFWSVDELDALVTRGRVA